MELALITVNKIVIMFIMGLVGCIGWWSGLIGEETKKGLSNVLLMLVSPLLIFTSYQQDFDVARWKGLLLTIALAFISHFIGILISSILFPASPKREYQIERIETVYSNCGFIGIPLVSAIFGMEGVFYMTAYITVFNLLIWTHGVVLMTGKSSLRSSLKELRTPCIIAIALGVICYVGQIRLPEMILEPLVTIANMNTPLAMLIAGAALAGSNLFGMLKNKRLYWVCFVKLVIIPVAVLFLVKLFRWNDMVTMTVILATACPAGTTGTLFAIRYRKNAQYASEIFGMSTFLSIVTLPLIMMLGSML